MHGVTLASLARDFGWFVEDEEAVNAVESALRTGEKVGLWMESGEGRELLGGATGRVEVVEEVRMLWQKALGAALVVTHRLLEEELEGLPFPVGVVRPRDLSVGLDCDRGVTLEEVEGCVFEGLREGRLAWASVRKLGSFDLHRGEQGLLQFAGKHRLPLEFHSEEDIDSVSNVLNPSGSAVGKTAVFGVSAAAALLSAGGRSCRGRLIASEIGAGRIAMAVAEIPPRSG